MANCLNYNCNDPLGDHVPVDCEEYPLGGVDAVIILECDHQLTDPSDGTEVQAEIDAGRATLIENVKFSIAEASAVTVPNPVACGVDRVINYDRSGSYVDANVNASNVDFYNTLNSGRAFGGMILRECAEGRVSWIDDALTFQGNRMIPDNDNEHQMFSGSFAWRSKVDMDIYDEPANIFSS